MFYYLKENPFSVLYFFNELSWTKDEFLIIAFDFLKNEYWQRSFKLNSTVIKLCYNW